MNKYKLLVALLSLSVLPITARTVAAEEFSISDNGSGSSSDVAISVDNSAQVNQSNNSDVVNTITTDTNTGGNSADGNTGENTAINTGDSSTGVAVANQLNESHVENGCCSAPADTAEITGNGQNSSNAISYGVNTNTNTNVTNTASITTNIFGKATTGNNSASNNNGNVSITTGSIKVQEKVVNTANNSSVHTVSSLKGGFTLKIGGNGGGSSNNIILFEDDTQSIYVNNVADIFNNSVWDLMTGNNTADDNNGDVVIKTGDIDLAVLLENSVNNNTVTVDCDCDKNPEPEKPTEGNPPSSNPGNGGNGGNNGGGGNGGVGGGPGSILGAMTGGNVLPATGNPWILLAILGNLMMLLFGTALRLRSGRSPSLAFA